MQRLNVFLGKACAKAAERAAADGMKQLAIHLGALALGEIPAIQAAVHNLFGS